MTESPRNSNRTASTSASVSSLVEGGRATRGKTVLTTRPVYVRLRGLVSRNVAVNRLTTPSPAITFPMTASIRPLPSVFEHDPMVAGGIQVSENTPDNGAIFLTDGCDQHAGSNADSDVRLRQLRREPVVCRRADRDLSVLREPELRRA